MKINVLPISGVVKDVPIFLNISDTVFDVKFCYFTIKQTLSSILKNSKICLKGRKNRSNVRGGGRKPWKQKGTGRARAGSIRSPLWKGGGCTFVPSFFKKKKKKINKKVSKFVLRSIVSELIRQNRLLVIHDISIEFLRTKDFLSVLSNFSCLNKKVVFVIDNISDILKRSSNNIFNVKLFTIQTIELVSLVNAEVVIFTISSLRNLERFLL